MMITGDYHHTAIAVAKDVGMVKPGREPVVIDTTPQQELQPKSSPATSQSASRAAAPTDIAHPADVNPQVTLGGTSQYPDDGQYQQQVLTPVLMKVTKQLSWDVSPGGDQAQPERCQIQLRPIKPHHQLIMQVSVQLWVRVRCLRPALLNQSTA